MRYQMNKNREFENARLQTLITKENTFEDFEIVNSMTDLEIMITERGNKKLPSYSEAYQANKLADEFKRRYEYTKLSEKHDYIKKHWRAQ